MFAQAGDGGALPKWGVRVLVPIAIAIAAAAAFVMSHLAMGTWTIDDAGITYAYAIRLADAGSLSGTPESMPVEGYSNPFLFLLVALLRWLGLFDPITTHAKIECLAFALMSALVFRLLRRRISSQGAVAGTALFVALQLLTPATWIWYRSGLENVYVSLGLVLLVYLADRHAQSVNASWFAVGVGAFVVALTRPESPVYVAAFYLAMLLFARPAQLGLRAHIWWLVRSAGLTSALYIAFLVWRRLTYGVWLPNTYYAKLGASTKLASNLTDYVFDVILPYSQSILFVSGLVVLVTAPLLRRLAGTLAIFTLASLVMPLVGGRDMMGEHRFATPYLAMAHLSAAVVISSAFIGGGTRREWIRRTAALAMTIGPLLLLVAFDRLGGASIPLNDVTASRVAELHGFRRIEHQRRLGLINPVVVAPDAGGTLLVGALQHIDNGYLTDFQMAHMRRDRGLFVHYQLVERVADLLDTNPQWMSWNLMRGRCWLHRDQHMFARRDLVEVTALPPGLVPFHAEAGVELYLSPGIVPHAGPHGLVRVEVIVAWSDSAQADATTLRGRIAFGDSDEISLRPYGDPEELPATGIQRRALLLAAPLHAGTYPMTLEVIRNGAIVASTRLLDVEVLHHGAVQRAVDKIMRDDEDPLRILRRLAWLREQWIPRLGITVQHELQARLLKADKQRNAEVATLLSSLQWDVRVAAFVPDVPVEIRDAERRVIVQHLRPESCPSGDGAPGMAARAVCIGRQVDLLRRFGYFGALEVVPSARRALVRIAHELGRMSKHDRYAALVGLTVAMPERVDLQQALSRARERITDRYPPLQGIPTR